MKKSERRKEETPQQKHGEERQTLTDSHNKTINILQHIIHIYYCSNYLLDYSLIYYSTIMSEETETTPNRSSVLLLSTPIHLPLRLIKMKKIKSN